jgi:hypothetical protein
MTKRTNEDRACAAGIAVDAYLAHKGDGDDAREDQISDLIADLGHLANEYGFDFACLLQRAVTAWEAERK